MKLLTLAFFTFERAAGEMMWSIVLAGFACTLAPKSFGAIFTDRYFELCDDDMFE